MLSKNYSRPRPCNTILQNLLLHLGEGAQEAACGISSSNMPGVYCSYIRGARRRGRFPCSTRPHAAHLFDDSPALPDHCSLACVRCIIPYSTRPHAAHLFDDEPRSSVHCFMATSTAQLLMPTRAITSQRIAAEGRWTMLRLCRSSEYLLSAFVLENLHLSIKQKPFKQPKA